MSIFKNISSKNILATVARFPYALCLSSVGGILMILIINGSFDYKNEVILGQTAIVLGIAGLLSIAAKLVAESLNFGFIKQLIIQIIPLAFVGLSYIFNIQKGIESYYVLFTITSLIASFCLILIAPFIGKWKATTNKQFYNYSLLFFRILAETLLLILLGTLLIAGFFFGIDLLFKIHFPEELFGSIVVSLIFIFSPIYAASKLEPIQNLQNIEKQDYSVFQEFFTAYFAFPAICLYLGILYTYTLQILFKISDSYYFWVTWLIIFFLFFAYVVYYLAYPFKEKNKALKIYTIVFPYFVIPQVLILFYALYLRIQTYGFTVNRYFVVIFVIFLLIISLYQIFSKKKFLVIIPAIFSVLIFSSSFGPWSIYTYPETQQFQLLQQNFKNLGMIQEGKLIPLQKITEENKALAIETEGKIRYLCRNYDCSELKTKYPETMKALFKQQKNQWGEKQTFETFLEESISGYMITDYLQLAHAYNYDQKNTKTFQGRINDKDLYPLELENYKYLEKLDFNGRLPKTSIEIINNGQVYTISLEDTLKKLYKDKFNIPNNEGDAYSKSELSFNFSTEKLDGQLIITNFYLQSEEQYSDIDGFILYNIK